MTIRRRSILAALLSGVLATGAVAVVTSAAFFPVTDRKLDLVRAQEIFRLRCASCHSMSAGWTTTGPSLHDIGRTAGSRQPGVSPEQYILDSIVRPSAFKVPDSTGEMPENVADGLTEDELASLTALLCSRGGTIRYRQLLSLSRAEDRRSDSVQLELDLGAVERGRALYLGRLECVRCHGLDKAPGNDLRAPNLLTVALFGRAYLRDAILAPEKSVSPRYENWRVVARGVSVSGRRLTSPPGTVSLLTANRQGDLDASTFAGDDLESDESHRSTWKVTGSEMPSYKLVLSESELSDLLDFLLTLR